MRYQIDTPTSKIRIAVDKILFTDPQTDGLIVRFRAKTPGFDCGGKTEVAAYDKIVEKIFQKRQADRLLTS